jgi:5-oxoprolinase (ATP-hydrolysing)
MGDTLVRTAHSTNIKERRDFSCAIFDAEGQLVANAPHIPVHLGAMGETVRHVIRHTTLRLGDVVATNDPYNGGSHLPDITLVSPVFRNNAPQFYVACRAHHADIGGAVPGSMPPFSTRLKDEGIVIRSLLLVHDHQFRETDVLSVLSSGAYPARNLPERLSDLRAQVAALRKGGGELSCLCDQFRDEVVTAYMRHIRTHAANITREALSVLLAGLAERVFHFSDVMDDGTVLRVQIRIFSDPSSGVQAEVDFSGTSAQVSGNLNAPPAVTRAAVLYVFRTLFQQPIPLNDGCLEPIRIKIPEDSLLKPNARAAVAGGNVETSQRIVDILYGALDIAAASQGTMNNVLFAAPDGTGAQYYETIAGGAGAVSGSHGASAVQVHMTNTRITDVEVLEHRFPAVRIERFEIRRGSGGKGEWRGGDGVARSYRFLQPQSLTVFSERRTREPFGLRGGKPGAPGRNRLIRSNGCIEDLDSKAHVLMESGDVLEVSTPGGGGFGCPPAGTE